MPLRLAHRTVDLDGPPLAMAIVNVTPDSFYDGGVSATPDRMPSHRALEMLAAGAAIVDVGGMTAQPGDVLGEDEEAARAVPTVAGIRAAAPGAVISVDTYRARGRRGGAGRRRRSGQRPHRAAPTPALAAAVAERDAGLVVTHLGPAAQAGAGRPLRDHRRRDRRVTARARRRRRGGRRAARRDPARPRPRLRQVDRHRPCSPARPRPADRARLSAAAGPLAQGGDRRAAGAAGVEPRGHGRGGRGRSRRRGARAPRPRPAVHGRVARMAWLASPRAEGYVGRRRQVGRRTSGTNLPPE